MARIIAQAAEAILKADGKNIIKIRIKKGYRLPILDKNLRKSRTNTEYSLMLKSRRAGINVPKLIEKRENEIVMEYIKGKTLRDSIDFLSEKDLKLVCRQVGEQLAKLHHNDIIHGDLTTSNMILNKSVYFIDFGLGFNSKRIEAKANDLHLLKQALKSKHNKIAKRAFDLIIKNYKKNHKEADSILKRLKIVESRRRYTG